MFDTPATILRLILQIVGMYRLTRLFFGVRKCSMPVFVIFHLLYVFQVLWHWAIIFPNFRPADLFYHITFLPHSFFANFPEARYFTIAVIITCTVIFLLTLCYESSKLKRISFAIFAYTLADSLLSASANTFRFIPATDLISFSPATHLHAGLWFNAIISISKRFFNKDAAMFVPRLFWYLALVFSLNAFAGYIMWRIDGQPINLAIATSTIMNLFGSIMMLVLYNAFYKMQKNSIEKATEQAEKEYYSSQLKLMQDSAEQIKSIRHDMKLHLSAAKYLAEKDAQAAEEYLSNLLGDITKSEIYSDTGNISFDSIINFKLNNAKIENLKLELNSLIPSEIDINIADIVTILGNLLDNALEALASPKVSEKILKLDIELSKASLFIQIENTFDGNLKFAKGKNGELNHLITRKENSNNNHGHGLKNIRHSVEKYNGQMTISCEDNVFSVAVVLYLVV